MVAISDRDVAERAGVEPAYVRRLVDVGVLAPATDGAFTDTDARRVRLYRGLEHAGLPLETVDAVAGAGLPTAHAGIDAGPVVFQGGDYFGRTVNLAARIMERARRGQVLVSDGVAESVDRERFALTSIGPVELKGVQRPVRLHSVERRS